MKRLLLELNVFLDVILDRPADAAFAREGVERLNRRLRRRTSEPRR